MTDYYEDLEIGDTSASDHGRTITEGEIFTRTSGNDTPIHTDREWVRKNTRFDDVLPPNNLITGTMDSMYGSDWDHVALAMYGKDNYRFPNPIYPGDTVSTRTEIVDKRTRDDESGIVRFRIELVNQRDEVTAVGENLLLVPRDPDRD